MQSIRQQARRCLAARPGAATPFIESACALTERLFSGRLWSYQPISLRYHDFQHTLQASYVYLALIEAGREHLSPEFAPTPREAELGFAAVLLHDSGYLKAKGDDEGTGAKYTHSHVLRSCALAASLLPTLDCTQTEIDDVLGAIRCTGLNGNPPKTHFSSERARTVACMVATADYLGQMAAPEYPAKLPALFVEFAEADEFNHVPPHKRAFQSVAQLMAATPTFWEKFVLPKLENDFAGVYRLLAVPHPDGPNPYLQAIEANLAEISALTLARASA